MLWVERKQGRVHDVNAQKYQTHVMVKNFQPSKLDMRPDVWNDLANY